MKFCKKCGLPLYKNNFKSGIFECKKCGYSIKGEDLKSKEKIPKKKEVGTGVKKDENEFATYKHKCKKCGYGKSQILDMGVFVSDEDTLILLKCGRCGYAERIGRRVA
jgi:DNA-directed RNA polymerase subunit M/transcription elongation factor TFIIS